VPVSHDPFRAATKPATKRRKAKPAPKVRETVVEEIEPETTEVEQVEPNIDDDVEPDVEPGTVEEIEPETTEVE